MLDQSEVDDEGAGTSLYTYDQTTEYKPPPVVNGKLPKNVYGNLDVYVSSMVPEGAIHLKHPETQRAARLLGVDYADAVTGFSFKGRHGTAIVNGAVVAIEHADAVQQLITGFEDERAQEENAKRSLEALRLWKRFLAGLRIRERIEGYDIEGDDSVTREIATDDDDQSDNEGGGGFFPSRDGDGIAEPTAGGWVDSNEQETDGGGFLAPSHVHSTQDHYARHELVDREAEAREFNESLPSDNDTFQKMPNTDSQTVSSPSSPNPVEQHTTLQPSSIASNREFHSGLEVASEKPPDANIHVTSTRAFPELGIADEEELMEARLLQQSYDLGSSALQSQREARTEAPGSPSPSLNPPLERDSTAPLEPSPEPRSSSRRSSPEGSQVHESGDDSGSLLLEDPSDEDADPEWIA